MRFPSTAMRFIGSIVGTLLLAVTANAEILTEPEKSVRAFPGRGSAVLHPALSIDIWVQNEIKDEDAKYFENNSTLFEHKLPIIHLAGNKGGDVNAAMRIGRIIRKYDGETEIVTNCFSSCALIFIAGVRRTMSAQGTLGLHRPYLASAPRNRETVEQQVPAMLSLVKNYVAEMGITDNFYQRMINTEPSQVVTYNWSNYTKLVPELDPLYDEIQVAQKARKYGITSAEMRRRQQEAAVMCKPNPQGESIYCYDAIKWGLSESVFRDRVTKLEKCWFSKEEYWGKEEWALYERTPRKSRDELPFLVQRENCERAIMLGR